jgi:hypothetical protein
VGIVSQKVPVSVRLWLCLFFVFLHIEGRSCWIHLLNFHMYHYYYCLISLTCHMHTRYEGMAQVSVALAVVQHRTRPPIPDGCPLAYRELMEQCWCQEAFHRPSFKRILDDMMLDKACTVTAPTPINGPGMHPMTFSRAVPQHISNGVFNN